MHPILVQIGPLTIYSYGVMLAVAVLVCSFLLKRDALRSKISPETTYDLVFWVIAGGIIGARIFYVMLFWDQYTGHALDMVMINKGGLAWQGGFVGGIIAGGWFVHLRKLSLRVVLDLAAPYIALGQSIGRVGCFFNGCCYGKLWEHGIYFPSFHERLHPTQLYEIISLFLIFIILKFAQRKPHRAGMIFVLYLWLAAIERFGVEFFRADHDLLWLGLSLSQYVAAGVFVAGIIAYLRFKK